MGFELKSSSFVHASDLGRGTAGNGVRRKTLGCSPDMMMARVDFKGGSVGCLHSYPQGQVSCIGTGKFRGEAGGNKSELSALDCFIVEPHVLHVVEAPEEAARSMRSLRRVRIFSGKRSDVEQTQAGFGEEEAMPRSAGKRVPGPTTN